MYINNKFFFILFVIQYIISESFFIKLGFGSKFNIKEKEIKKNIVINLNNQNKNYITNINGFYGLIGPDCNINNITSISDLFLSDGIIQGVFFNDDRITYVKNYIKTHKLLYEQENGKIPDNKLIKFIFDIFSKFKLLPSPLDVSNTALININKEIYSLYETELPYKLEINFNTSEIRTVKKININSINHFSAHSKFYKNHINTIDYDIFGNTINFFLLDDKFKIIKNKKINTKYIPVIHDFYILDEKIFFIDSPLSIDYFKILNTKMPIKLETNKKSIINIIDKQTLNNTKYYLNDSIYLFHYANIDENITHYNIYASTYDYIDFNELNISGKYREISINKETKEVNLNKNNELEELNLEFPINYNNLTLFRSINNQNINDGFVICNKLEIIKKIKFPNKFICGEPSIKKVGEIYYLIFFYYDLDNKSDSKLVIMDMSNYNKTEICINEEINIGFHSIFIDKN